MKDYILELFDAMMFGFAFGFGLLMALGVVWLMKGAFVAWLL